MSIAFLFPGQGSQRAGTLASLPGSVAAQAALSVAEDVLGGLAILDDASALRRTTAAQLSLLVAGVASAHALIETGVEPDVVAGHSVGSFAAAVIAGVLTLPQALTAVQLRGAAMERACARGTWGMAAVLGSSPRDVRRLAERSSTEDEPAWLANDNAPGQAVVGGTAAALARVTDGAAAIGAQAVRRLDVATASHGPVQAGTAEQLRDHLRTVTPGEQRLPWMSNAGGRRVGDDARAVLLDLAASVARVVRWREATAVLLETGVDRTIEMTPGRTLTDLLRNRPGVQAIAMEGSSPAAVARRIA